MNGVDVFEVPLPEDVALVTARLAIYATVDKNGTNHFVVHAKGDSPMTTYLGLLVAAQQEVLQWGAA